MRFNSNYDFAKSFQRNRRDGSRNKKKSFFSETIFFADEAKPAADETKVRIRKKEMYRLPSEIIKRETERNKNRCTYKD